MKLQAVNFEIIDFDMEKRKIDSLKFVVENVENWYKVLHGLRRVRSTTLLLPFCLLSEIFEKVSNFPFSIFDFSFSSIETHKINNKESNNNYNKFVKEM